MTDEELRLERHLDAIGIKRADPEFVRDWKDFDAFVVHLLDDHYGAFRLCDRRRYTPPWEDIKKFRFCGACKRIAFELAQKEFPMLVGDKVFHVPTKKVVTVRNPNTGNGFVGVHWHARADDGTVAEHTAGYHWQQIRNATAEELHAEEARMAELFPPEKASDPSAPAGSDTSAAPDVSPSAESDTPPSAETHHKRKRQ
jgi:hypothetical protein